MLPQHGFLRNRHAFLRYPLDKCVKCVIIIAVQRNIAESCKGSTTASDSVCLGSNPSSAAKKDPNAFAVGSFFCLLLGFERSVKKTSRCDVFSSVGNDRISVFTCTKKRARYFCFDKLLVPQPKKTPTLLRWGLFSILGKDMSGIAVRRKPCAQTIIPADRFYPKRRRESEL